MPVSRPAVSQHLKILKEAGLVTDQAQGTRRVYGINRDGLAALKAWLDGYWEDGREAYQAEIQRPADERKCELSGDCRAAAPSNVAMAK